MKCFAKNSLLSILCELMHCDDGSVKFLQSTFQVFSLYHIPHVSEFQGNNRLCGLVVRVLGYRSGGPGLIPGTTRKKKKRVVGLERGALSLVSTTEELLDRKVAAPV
jgi:hypothetical protein